MSNIQQQKRTENASQWPEFARVLATKLYVPPARPKAVARPALVEKLLSGVSQPGAFSLLSAPAGFGKTTLLSEFVDRLQCPLAWVSLDDGDNDPVRFWTHLVHACQKTSDETTSSLLGAAQSLPDDTIPAILINHLAQQNQTLVLVLDDYHVIHNASIHAGIAFMLDHLPATLHVVIATRIDPPWPLARYRARNQLFETRAQDLRFNTAEATEFLRDTMTLDLPAEDIAALETRTEGWIAGLQLAALSMQTRHDTSAFIRAFTGSHVYVAEYLVEEVLQRQPEPVQSFLLQTSLLERLNADLCDAVTGHDGGQAMLAGLYRANIFVVALDNEARWYRYHHLFADLLRARLPQIIPDETIAEIHRRAASWYETNGFFVEAVNHSLAAEDFETVVALVKRAAHTTIFSGRVNVLRDWLEAIPQHVFRTHPHLIFYQFWIDLLQGRADLSDRALRDKENSLRALPSTPENDQLRGELMAVICRAMVLSGRTAGGIRLAHEALAYLGDGDQASRARAQSALAIAHGFEGRAGDAESAYRKCLSLAYDIGDYRLAAHTTMAMGLLQTHYGQLHQAARTFQTIIDMGQHASAASSSDSVERDTFFPAGQGYIGLASVHLEWNNLETAERLLARGMQLCRRGGLDGLFVGRMLKSRLHQATGDLEQALSELQSAKQGFQRVDDFTIATRHIEIALAQGDTAQAAEWAAPLLDIFDGDTQSSRVPLVFLEEIQPVVARVLLAQGAIDNALQLLVRLQKTAEPRNHRARLIELYLLRALAQQAAGGAAVEAVDNIKHALQLAAPEHFVLTFLQQGAPVVPLLAAVVRDITAPEPVRTHAQCLLDAFGTISDTISAGSSTAAAGLIEQLTPREREVLDLIAAGDFNQEIAGKLFITERTVKKHAGNIYGKLNVSSRMQAVIRARELGLLPPD